MAAQSSSHYGAEEIHQGNSEALGQILHHFLRDIVARHNSQSRYRLRTARTRLSLTPGMELDHKILLSQWALGRSAREQ
jgi:hypothetical protein